MTGRGLLLLPLCFVVLFVIAPAALADPTRTAAPVVTGTSTLSLDPGTWTTTSGNGITYDYQWQSCSYPNAVIGDAPLAYYRLGDDLGVDVSGLDQPQLDATYTTHSGGIAGDSDTAYYNSPVSWAPGVTYPTTTGEGPAPSDFPSGNAPITIEAWIKPDAYPHDDAFIAGVGNDATPGTSLNLELYNKPIIGPVLAAFDGAHRYIAYSGVPSTRTWTHVAVTYDGTTIRLWLNGTVVGTFTANLSLDPAEARIGASVPATTTEQAFGGSIDEVAFYGSALNATALAAHISAGQSAYAGGRCNDIPGATDTTFTVTPDLGGTSIRGQVQASDDTGTAVAWSNSVSEPGSVVVPQHADLTHSPNFGPLLVGGTVVDASGGPVAGARVSVYQNLSTRTRVSLPIIGEAITDADGNYSISYGDGSIATLNLVVTARGTGVAATTFVDRVYDASGAWLDGDGLLPQPLQLALPANATPQPLAGASRAIPFYQCPPPSKKLIAGPYPGIMNVADVHTWSYTKAQLTYMKAQTRVNIAASFTSDGGFVSTSSQAGANGGYSITQAYPIRPANTSIVETTGYSAAEYAFGSCLSWTYTVEPYRFIGGTTAPRSAPLGSSGKCKTTLTNNSVPEVPGARVTRTNATGVTYSNGFTVSFGGFSVGLTIRTDWSNSLTEVWWPQSGGGRKLWFCGDGTKPYWYQAQRIYQAVDLLKLGVTLAAALAGGVLAACGGDPGPGTLGSHAGEIKLSFGWPAKPGQILTATQMAVTYRNGKGITIQSVEPLGLHGPARYLGTALLLPPRQGFEMNLSHHFPTIAIQTARWARLPYTTTTASGAIDLGVGFDLSRPGATSFAGLAVRYRQHGHEYVAVVPLGVRVCVAKHRTGSCAGPPSAEVPEESVRPA